MFFVKKHFLPQDLITGIMGYVEKNVASYMWKTNLSWDSSIVEKGGQVSILDLKETIFCEQIKQQYLNLKLLPSLKSFHPQVYVWQRGSHIPWHDDYSRNKDYAGSTIYLNVEWDINSGGLFLYKEDNQIKAEVPEYNKMIFLEKIEHAVTMITPSSPNVRITMQCFFSYN